MLEVSCKVVFVNPDKSKVLIVEYDDGMRGLPGGHVERGETLDETIHREIKEELGIDYTGKLNRLDFGLNSWTGRASGLQHEKVILGYVGELSEDTKIRHEIDNVERVAKLLWLPIADALNPDRYYGDTFPELIRKATGWTK
jgi:8-oxo-dGTP pyrophosphatase MutT (NUDIX family)